MKTWSLKVIKCLAQRQRAGKEKARIWPNICQTLELVKNAQTTTQLHSSHTLVGGGNGTPLYYSCLENPMDGGAWWAVVHGVAKSRTWLRDFTFTLHFHALEKEMATHSSVLAWRIPGMGESGGLPSVGSHRVWHDWSELAAAARASKVMLKILQARLQQYVNPELPDVQAGFRKGRETRDQIANICWIIKKAREFQKNIYFLLYWLCQSLLLCGSQ